MDYLLRFMVFLTNILRLFLSPIFWMLSKRRRLKVPSMNNNILLCSASHLAEQIRRRQLSSEEVIKVYIQRVKVVNPIINAILEERFEQALEEARIVDEFLDNFTGSDEELLEQKPLLGVPVTIKESCSVKGMYLTSGCIKYKDRRAPEDGEAVKLLRDAGGIVLLVSNTPELSMYWETNNLLRGCTRNPYNTNYTSGGSSGGEGALIGSGSSIVGIGSDVAGSIRLPALFNGIFAHKPTSCIVSTVGHYPVGDSNDFRLFMAIGPLTRYAEDLTLIMNVISGANRGILNLNEKVDIQELRISWMIQDEPSFVLLQADKEIGACLEKCVEHLQKIGCLIDNHALQIKHLTEISSSIFFSIKDIPNVLSSTRKKDHSLVMEFIKKLFNKSKFSCNGLLFTLIHKTNGVIMKSKTEHYVAELDNLKSVLLEQLSNDGVLLLPTFPTAAFQHYDFLANTSGVRYLSIFNLLGFPCTHVPMGLNKKGLPIGIQIVAAPYQDRICLALAKELEAAFGGWVAPE